MFSFLGLRKEPKKSSPEKESDGGFVIIGEKMFAHRFSTLQPFQQTESAEFPLTQC